MELTGKRALVTGGTRGIGAAVAIDLARNGADVVVNGRRDDGAAREVCGEIARLGRKGPLVTADIAKPEECERLVQAATDALGGLDILIHSAGGPAWGTIDQVTPEVWNAAFDVHVHAAYHLCRHALPFLKRNREGAIVLVSSVAGLRGCPNAVAYGTVKGAILQFTRMLARDLADDNIRVNCVAPGVIRTDFHARMTEDAKAHNLKQRIPLHREGTPADVSQVVHLLLTNEFMTGESITIDGGMSMQVTR